MADTPATPTPIVGASDRAARYHDLYSVMLNHFLVPDLADGTDTGLKDMVAFFQAMVEMRIQDGVWPSAQS